MLTLQEKLQIVKLVDKGSSYESVAACFNVRKSTVSDVWKAREHVKQFVTELDDCHAKSAKKRCIIRRSNYEHVDKALHLWFLQQRAVGTPISGSILQTKAQLFYSQFHPNDNKFKASKGYLQRFKDRYGIRKLTLQGESLSARTEEVQPFKDWFNEYKRDNGLTEDMVFNADETGLNWKLLQNSTLASGSEQTAKNFKVAKDRVTVLVCANATGKCKIPLAFIHKYAKPRCLKYTNFDTLPVYYYSQRNAWMECRIFERWFADKFCPTVKHYLASQGLPQKALLLVNNAACHTDCSLATADNNIVVKFLPANTTSILQPMDQGVCEQLKRCYRRLMLEKMLLSDSSGTPCYLDYIKNLKIKDCIFLIAEAWDKTPQSTLFKAWNKVYSDRPSSNGSSSSTENGENSPAQNPPIPEELQAVVSEWEVSDVNDPGYEQLTDEAIVQYVRGQDGPEEEEEEGPYDNEEQQISHLAASKAFQVCIDWFHQQSEGEQSQILLLQRLQYIAHYKYSSNLRQTSITDFTN